MVYRFVFSLSGDRQIAEDVTQETFERAFGAMGSSPDGARLDVAVPDREKTRTFPTCARRVGTCSRTKCRMPPPPTKPVGEGARASDHRALHKMREPYKEVLTLRVFGELDYAECRAV
jgi:RNA polymerase sigma-70 factor (ECF subfamily)